MQHRIGREVSVNLMNRTLDSPGCSECVGIGCCTSGRLLVACVWTVGMIQIIIKAMLWSWIMEKSPRLDHSFKVCSPVCLVPRAICSL